MGKGGSWGKGSSGWVVRHSNQDWQIVHIRKVGHAFGIKSISVECKHGSIQVNCPM